MWAISKFSTWFFVVAQLAARTRLARGSLPTAGSRSEGSCLDLNLAERGKTAFMLCFALRLRHFVHSSEKFNRAILLSFVKPTETINVKFGNVAR